jgi:hypothetical protein
MTKNIIRSPIFWASGEFVTIFLVELIVIKTLELKEFAVHATILAAAFWLFLGFMGFYHELDKRIAFSVGGLSPILTNERFTGFARTLTKLVSAYDSIEHPLLRALAEQDLSKSLNGINLTEQRSSEMTHEDFGFAVERYIRTTARTIHAFTRSTVTNWDQWYAAGEAYFKAQHGKSVTRVFVLTDTAEYEHFAENVLSKHAQAFGADNILICSCSAVNEWINSLNPSNRVEEDEDFAIFDDNIVAFCKGKVVQVRVDNVLRCRKVFDVVSEFARRRNQSYAAIKSGTTKLAQVFST